MKIVITGTSTGIGRALAMHLLDRGHSVWGLARSDQSDFAKLQPGFRSSRCDVSAWPAMEQAATDIQNSWGSIDALITCAGIQGAIGPAMAADPFAWSATVRANLDGTYYALRSLYNALRRSSGRGKVICFSGGGATKARPNFSAYGVAKTGIVRLVEMLAEELRNDRVDLNSIAPGAINTRLTEEVLALGPAIVGDAEYKSALKQKETGGAALEKVYSLVDFLLGEDSDGISGRLLSAPWDPWVSLKDRRSELRDSDIYQLRRILPEDRQKSFN